MFKKYYFVLLFVLSQMAMGAIGLSVGDKVPDISLVDSNGKEFNLSKQEKDTVFVFYRGSW